jgi:hypothetical protein
MLTRSTLILLLAPLLLVPALPGLAEASAPSATPPAILSGDQVIVNGSLHRKCAATVESIPSPGFARLKFERSGCGDSAQVYELKHLQHLSFVAKSNSLSPGDDVTLKGHFGADCMGRVKGLSRSGYVSVDLESLLCADTEALYKARDLTKISFVSEASSGFSAGQKISTTGIHEEDSCSGEITRLTSNGLAQIKFDQLTCAYAGKLYPVAVLTVVKALAPHKRVSGDLIFQRVMREIASAKKGPLSVR